ncbi:MAG TPA: hypothetical protein VE989_12935 [Sphingomicrobium sp.]|nr:hypothetical protein [Sphingomicrobium sp.]
MLAPLPALAQSVPDAATNTTDSIGPRELQNFSLNGTVTRQADTPAPAPAPRRPARQPTSDGATGSPTAATEPRRTAAPPPVAARESAARGDQALALDLPPATPATSALPASVPQSGFPSSGPGSATFAPEQKPALWPWLLLAAVLGAGAALLLLRRRSRESFAGAPEIDSYVAPEPAAPPPPAPVPGPAPEAAPPRPVGIVSSRLRPWVEIVFAPLGCTVDDERVTVEFEIQLTNSGGATARDVLVEASMFNAGPTQEQDIGAFFAAPIGQGERIEALPPLQHVTIRTSLVAPRANIQIFELGGRQVFVPLIAFNALYRLGSGNGQTSVAYLLGRETSGDKLGPLRVDLGARAFTALGIRPLPVGVRE